MIHPSPPLDFQYYLKLFQTKPPRTAVKPHTTPTPTSKLTPPCSLAVDDRPLRGEGRLVDLDARGAGEGMGVGAGAEGKVEGRTDWTNPMATNLSTQKRTDHPSVSLVWGLGGLEGRGGGRRKERTLECKTPGGCSQSPSPCLSARPPNGTSLLSNRSLAQERR